MRTRKDARFSDAFLIVTPGITVRDRLRVLLPQDPEGYYRTLDLVPPNDRERLGQARVRDHQLPHFPAARDRAASMTTKALLARRRQPVHREPRSDVRRVARELGTKRNIVVLNDEAHHCYRRRAGLRLLKRALRAASTRRSTGRAPAVSFACDGGLPRKVINHCGDEVVKACGG